MIMLPATLDFQYNRSPPRGEGLCHRCQHLGFDAIFERLSGEEAGEFFGDGLALAAA